MNQHMLAAICRAIIGPTGRRIAAYPDIQTAYTQGLYADYYRLNPIVCEKTCRKYCCGTTPYPHFLHRHYGDAGGYRRTLADMMDVVDTCPSITQLRSIQDDVHAWVSTHLSAADAQALDAHYAAQDTTRRQIAEYLADVMQYAITH